MSRVLNCLFRHDAIWDVVIFVLAALLPMLAMLLALTRGVVVERDVMMIYVLVWLLPVLLYMIARLAVIIRDNQRADVSRHPYRAVAKRHFQQTLPGLLIEISALSRREQEILLRETFDSVLRERFGS